MTTTHVVTFHKCGSNWFRRLFRDAAGTHGANIDVSKPNTDPINTPVATGSDTTLALYRTDTAETVLSRAAAEDTVILCLRDPKDVLISQYFSWKKTHAINSSIILDAREKLNALSMKLGQRFLVHKELLPFCKAIETWQEQIAAGRVVLLKYEDLLDDFAATMGPALQAAGIPLDADGLADLEAKYSFSAVTRRAPGTEDTSNHYRKGVAGDWRNYFDARLTKLFNARYGPLCQALGYEPATAQANTLKEAPATPSRTRKSDTASREIAVLGFPKCGTTALMRALESAEGIDVLRTPEMTLEIAWPAIRTMPRTARPGHILAHKFTAYVYNAEALTYLRDSNPDLHCVLCIRDPRKALVSWHNMHRRIATDGKTTGHFAWVEREFYATCDLTAYYKRFARDRLAYDRYLEELLKIVPAKRLTVVSQESMARNMNSIVAALKAAAQGNPGTIQDTPQDGAGHESFADRANIDLPPDIAAELAATHDRVLALVAENDIQSSL